MVKFTSMLKRRTNLLLSTISTGLDCNGEVVNISSNRIVAAASCWRLDASITNCKKRQHKRISVSE